MPKKTRKVKKNNLKIGIIFSAIILILIGLSLAGKLFFLLGQGKYDDNYPFSIKVTTNTSTQYLSISPKQHKVNILTFGKVALPAALQIPQDAQISGNPVLVTASSISSYFASILSDKKIKTNLTSVDISRLYVFSKTLSQSDVTMQSVSALDEKVDKIISSAFSDPTIVSEDLRVEIVNATGAYGVGNSAAGLLTHIGANVVFVSTADSTESKSVIYYTGSKSYTAQRIARVLGFKLVESKQKTISDIEVRVGQDSKDFIDK